MTTLSTRHIPMFLAVSFLAGGLGLAVSCAVHGKWISCIVWLLCGVLAAIFWLLEFWRFWDEIPQGWKLGAAIAGAVGVYAIFFEHPAFDMARQTAHIEAFNAFLDIETECYPKSRELEALTQEGIRACALQDNVSMMDAIGQLQKAERLGPTLSIIDGVNSAAAEPKADRCARAYLATRRLCSLPFSTLSKRSVASLEAE